MVWYFSSIVFYILTAAVLSIIGHPLVRLLDKIKLGRFHMPHFLSSIIALIAILAVLGGLMALFVPLVLTQVSSLSTIDPIVVQEAIREPLKPVEDFMLAHDMIDQDLTTIIQEKLTGFLAVIDYTSLVDRALNFTGSLFIAMFSIVFLTFFFLKDEGLFTRGVLGFVPDEYVEDTKIMMADIRRLLTRYFIGISLEILIMMTLLTIGIMFTGLNNALLIGVIGGFLNVIPYLGPIIGCTVGVAIGITTNLTPDNLSFLPWIAIYIIAVFSAANLIDNWVLQPTIYSTSVKAHPIEIFLVILMAGSLAGVIGMILAIPAYTVFRVFARQFFGQFKIVSTLTRNM